MFKVLHLSYNDWGAAGGTSIGLCRLHWSLQKAGVDSKILCRIKRLESSDSIAIRRSRVVEGVIKEVTGRLGLNDLQGISSFSIKKYPVYRAADVLHLHSLHSGYFNYFALPELTQKKRTFWTLYDLWGLTGHCSYMYDCQRWKTGCGRCPYPETYPAIQRDGTAWEWKFKRRIYECSNLEIICPSRWVADLAKQSLLGRFPIHTIPFGIDPEVYRPLDKEKSRARLGVPAGKKIIFVSAVNLDERRKGVDLLVKALSLLPASLRKETVILTMGGHHGEDPFKELGMQTIQLGYIEDEELKAGAYSAADLYAFPSRSETFGFVAIESMACETPVAAFRGSGIMDAVRHDETGYAAEPENVEDYSRGILKLLEDETYRVRLGRQGREVVLKEYTQALQTQRHLDLYQLAPASAKG